MSSGFVEFLADHAHGFDGLGFRRMFGGHGIYRHGLMIALVADDTLYLKVDEQARPAFEAEGLGPFVYQGKGKPVAMSYWRCPERCLDDPVEMRRWLEQAHAAALRAAAARRPRKRAKPDAST